MSKQLIEESTLYLNAGGRGTRLKSTGLSIPGIGVAKSLLTVGNPPITLIDHHLNRAHAQGYVNILIGLGDQVNYVAGRRSNRLKRATSGKRRYGTGGDLLLTYRRYRQDIGNTVIIHNVDTILDIDDADIVKQHRRLGTVATIALTRSSSVPNEQAFLVEAGGIVLYSHEAGKNSLNLQSAEAQTAWRGSSVGVVALSSEFLDSLDWRPSDGEYSLYSDILAVALGWQSLAAYDNEERFFLDVGTPEKLALARQPGGPVQPYLQYGDYDRAKIDAYV